MMLITKAQREKLLANGEAQQMCLGKDGEIDYDPVVKLFTPDAQAAWLLTEIDPLDTDVAFGLCDLGLGFPELGIVSLMELQALRGRLGLPVECDRHFEASHPLSFYAQIARERGRIVV